MGCSENYFLFVQVVTSIENMVGSAPCFIPGKDHSEPVEIKNITKLTYERHVKHTKLYKRKRENMEMPLLDTCSDITIRFRV